MTKENAQVDRTKIENTHVTNFREKRVGQYKHVKFSTTYNKQKEKVVKINSAKTHSCNYILQKT